MEKMETWIYVFIGINLLGYFFTIYLILLKYIRNFISFKKYIKIIETATSTGQITPVIYIISMIWPNKINIVNDIIEKRDLKDKDIYARIIKHAKKLIHRKSVECEY